VATNSIRGGANRRVLDRIFEEVPAFDAWSDEPWIVEGAAVRVSLVCFGQGDNEPRLNGRSVLRIHSDLTGGGLDLTKARRLNENVSIAFMGGTKGGAFDVTDQVARAWLLAPSNPNGRPNSDVLRPWVNASDIVRRRRNMWVIDFGTDMSSKEAAMYEMPFEHLQQFVRADREKNRREGYRTYWWRHMETRAGLRRAIASLERFICTPKVAKHRVFVWLNKREWPENLCDAIARDDDTTFGILHSRFHEAWSLRLGTSLEDRPRYTPTTTFETFPFPEGLTPNIPAADYADDPRAVAIAQSARRLDALRNAWLNPPDLVSIEPEVVPGYPDRILPKNVEAAALLRDRTLTKLYNARPQWLADAHRDLDAAVAAAYGWPADICEDDALARLLELNLSRPYRSAS
jgi:type II restriction/modification system DNA methylase subunit YeeA